MPMTIRIRLATIGIALCLAIACLEQSLADSDSPALSRYDFELVRGESVVHAAKKPIVFVNEAGVGVKQDTSLFTDDLIESLAHEPEIEGLRGMKVEILDLRLVRAPADASSVLELHGEFQLSAAQGADVGERTVRVRLPALLEWSQENNLLTSSDSQFEFMGRIYESKSQQEKLNAGLNNTAESATNVRSNSNNASESIMWLIGSAILAVSVVVAWFTFGRRPAKES